MRVVAFLAHRTLLVAAIEALAASRLGTDLSGGKQAHEDDVREDRAGVDDMADIQGVGTDGADISAEDGSTQYNLLQRLLRRAEWLQGFGDTVTRIVRAASGVVSAFQALSGKFTGFSPGCGPNSASCNGGGGIGSNHSFQSSVDLSAVNLPTRLLTFAMKQHSALNKEASEQNVLELSFGRKLGKTANLDTIELDFGHDSYLEIPRGEGDDAYYSAFSEKDLLARMAVRGALIVAGDSIRDDAIISTETERSHAITASHTVYSTSEGALLPPVKFGWAARGSPKPPPAPAACQTPFGADVTTDAALAGMIRAGLGQLYLRPLRAADAPPAGADVAVDVLFLRRGRLRDGNLPLGAAAFVRLPEFVEPSELCESFRRSEIVETFFRMQL